VPIMDEKPIGVVTLYRFSQLLHGPLCSGMSRDIAMNDSTGADFHHYEYVKDDLTKSVYMYIHLICELRRLKKNT